MEGVSPLVVDALRPLWGLYFDSDALEIVDRPLIYLVERLAAWFILPEASRLLSGIVWESQTVVVFSWKEFKALESMAPIDEVIDSMGKRAEAVHHLMSLALCLVRGIHNQARALERAAGFNASQMPNKSELLSAAVNEGPLATKENRMVARFSCVTPLGTFNDIRAQTLGRWISVRGTVLNVSKFRSRVVKLPFRCTTCQTTAIHRLVDGKWSSPTQCASAQCRSHAFDPLRDQAEHVDIQRIRLQEREEHSHLAGGERLGAVTVELTNDLCDTVQPGCEITVGGVIRAVETDVARGGGTQRGSGIYMFFLQAWGVFNHSAHSDGYTPLSGDDGLDVTSASGSQLPVLPTTPAGRPGGGGGLGFGSSSLAPEEAVLSGLELTARLYDAIGGPPQIPASGTTGSTRTGGVAATQSAGNGALGSLDDSRSGSSDAAGNVAPRKHFVSDIPGFTETDLRGIARIRNHGDPASLVLASFAPSIMGNELVKLGLLLGLFGGTHHGQASRVARQVMTSVQALYGSQQNQQSQQQQGGRAGAGSGSRRPEQSSASLPRGGGGFDGSGADDGGDAAAAASFSDVPEVNAAFLSSRSDSHILVVGDPGLGKSMMLMAARAIAPRGVYVSGTASSGAGLTATMGTDADTGDPMLQAGALVLSDHGVCCIDEFDKMSGHHSALLEAMEQQRVTIAKAGVLSSLPARATVIAAANPKGGRYDKRKTVSENLKIATPVLSRFDLVFILVDRFDAARDAMLAQQVIHSAEDAHHHHSAAGGSQHSGGRGGHRGGRGSGSGGGRFNDGASVASGYTQASANTAVTRAAGNDVQAEHNRNTQFIATRLESTLTSSFAHGGAGTQSLETRLFRGILGIDSVEIIPTRTLRKYVDYSRRYCHPHMTKEAVRVLLRFYLELRQQSGSGFGGAGGGGFGGFGIDEGATITTRQIEALVRMCEARAKLELRDTVFASDAQDVVGLLKASRYLSGGADESEDGLGAMPFELAQGASAAGVKSKPKQAELLLRRLELVKQSGGDSVFTLDELQQHARHVQLAAAQGTSHDFHDFVDFVNVGGRLLEHQGGKNGKKAWRLS